VVSGSSDIGSGIRRETWAERYRLSCVRCGNVQILTYEVRRYVGRAGREWIVHVRDGRPVRPPHLDARCAACGGLRVRLLPKRSGKPVVKKDQDQAQPVTDAGEDVPGRRVAPLPWAISEARQVPSV
jgi:hypothetical protein